MWCVNLLCERGKHISSSLAFINYLCAFTQKLSLPFLVSLSNITYKTHFWRQMIVTQWQEKLKLHQQVWSTFLLLSWQDIEKSHYGFLVINTYLFYQLNLCRSNYIQIYTVSSVSQNSILFYSAILRKCIVAFRMQTSTYNKCSTC